MPLEHDIYGAIARGWTHLDNHHKEVDPVLARAIGKEVMATLHRGAPAVTPYGYAVIAIAFGVVGFILGALLF